MAMLGYRAISAQPSVRLSGLRLENALLLAPIPVGFVMGLIALICGADVGYVALEMITFALVSPLLFIIRHDDRYTATVFLVSFAKIFFISQFVCLLMLRAPDAGLMRPRLTIMAIDIGLVAGMLGIGAAALLFAAMPRVRPILEIKPDPAFLRRLGFLSGAVGLGSQAVWSFIVGRLTGEQHGGVGGIASGLSAFAHLTPLALLSMCCFAAARLISSGGKKIGSKEFFAVLVTYLVLILPLATKAEPLKPIVAIAILAFAFKWRPSLPTVMAGVLGFVFVAEFLYPTITMSRLRAMGERQSLPVVFVETALEEIADPSELAYAKAFTKNYDRTSRMFYYGKPMGFLDRFTPRVTDLMVTGAEYNTPVGTRELVDAAKGMLPQSFGFKKDVVANQRRLEAAFLRRKSGKNGEVGWENSGLVGDGYLAGGPAMTAVYLFLFGFMASVTARVTFGTDGNTVMWIPFVVGFMLIPSDTQVDVASIYLWGWVALTVSSAVLVRLAAGRSSPHLTPS